jgi:glucoamylase
VVWTKDHWKTTQSTMGRSLGSAGYSADVCTAGTDESGVLSWTLHWPGQNRWLGYNVEISIEPPSEA